ncbi:MAG: peptide-methionine (R)-S-oxide reductase [Pseudomonadota bacterium]|jgi:peptide-methionine (R)-S-oxide reductase
MPGFERTASRRALLLGAGATLGASLVVSCARAATDPYAGSPFRKVSEAEWRKRLPPRAFAILRREDTEPPGSSPLLNEKRTGTYHCLGCDLPLFRSAWKYDSGTGWPSFHTAIPGALGFKTDWLIGVPRTEYHCARCLGHHGHRFDDGPRPTGLRYCSNGFALRFQPA